MSASMEERLKRRKLDALKRGIHRVTGGEALPVGTHVIGIGKAGTGVIAEMLRNLSPDGAKFFALAIDIGEHDLGDLRELAKGVPPERADVTIVSLDMPRREDLLAVLGQYQDFLRLEYLWFKTKPEYQPWLPETVDLPLSPNHVPRAVAKAIYGQAYYGKPRTMERVLRRFADSVDAEKSQAIVSIVFGIGGGTGSGMAVDLARHLSNVIFGHRVLVAGVGIMPCNCDRPEHTGGHLFPVISELDCLCDETKNRGVVMSCGELFRNPFTAGFIVIPQQHVWQATQNLAETQRRCNQEIVSMLTLRNGSSMWELLRLLNWVAAPSTQHSAARTPWGPRWLHMLGFADASGPLEVGPKLPAQLGLLPAYMPEFIELRVPGSAETAGLASALEQAFNADMVSQVVDDERQASVQFILPCISKWDLDIFWTARDAYETERYDDRLLDHSLLLEQGIMLCKPSARLPGMAGASLWGEDNWIAVPLAELYGHQAVTDEPGLKVGQVV